MLDIGKTYVALLCAAATLSLAVIAEANPAAPESVDSPLKQSVPFLVADSTDDGPHVYWQSDSSAIVFYLCRGEVETRTFQPTDTLRFRGFCGDLATEYVIPVRAPEIQPYIYDDVSKIFAVSDIHGEYEALIELLENAGVIDETLHWAWGDGHLVINGDIFDRGDKVTECLWLIYRLEREARLAGGWVHIVLGNHELMVMRGDNRYVNEKYLDGVARKTRIKYEDLYGPQMELGRWLRTKNAAIRLSGILFVHGGISPQLAERGLSLEDINRTIRLSADMPSYEIAFSDTTQFLLRGEGPLWYRGYHYEMEGRYLRATQDQVEAILSSYGAGAIVVGHTEAEQVEGLYEGRVFRIDVPLQDLNSLQALLWKDDNFYRVTGSGELQLIE